jgi:hypothetical protein
MAFDLEVGILIICPKFTTVKNLDYMQYDNASSFNKLTIMKERGH